MAKKLYRVNYGEFIMENEQADELIKQLKIQNKMLGALVKAYVLTNNHLSPGDRYQLDVDLNTILEDKVRAKGLPWMQLNNNLGLGYQSTLI